MFRTLTFLTMILWLCIVGVGLRYMARYEQTPGVEGNPAARWQTKHLVTPHVNKPTLIMLAHPKCPCTRASLTELKRLLAHCANKVQVAVLFFVPAHAPTDWRETDLWKSAAALPDVTILEDRDGIEAKHLHVETSGEILLYAPNGKLLFHGGITAGRGHEGSNAGRTALEKILTLGTSPIQQTPVYGCPLYRSSSSTISGGKSCRK